MVLRARHRDASRQTQSTSSERRRSEPGYTGARCERYTIRSRPEDPSDHDLRLAAHHPPRRHGRVLRGGGAARPAGAARQGAAGRRHRAARGGVHRELRGAPVRSRQCDADGARAAPLSARDRARAPLRALPGGLEGGDGHPRNLFAAGGAVEPGRGVHRHDGVRDAVWRPAGDGGGGAPRGVRSNAAHRIGRCLHDQVRRERSQATGASPTG